MTNFTTLHINVDSESGLYNSILTVLKHISIMYSINKITFKHKHIDVMCVDLFYEPTFLIIYNITNCKDYNTYKLIHRFI